MKDKIAAVKRAARRGKVSCARLLKLAEAIGAAPAALGKICDREGIKIVRCRLGCFD
ncbi:MAG: hypothetical protein PHF00_05685 [Elusimicrobia bacterium]|nr:hypothetical protein [Elusimicrobiota bacterium]